MRHFLLTCLFSLAASCLIATDLDPLLLDLRSDDYSSRETARSELTRVFAEATAPGAELANRKRLEEEILEQVRDTSPMPLPSRLFLIRLIERFGSPGIAKAIVPLLDDSEKEVRDSARRALTAIPGDNAFNLLLEALEQASSTEKPAFIDALAYRGDHRAIPALVEILQSGDPALVSSTALALGKLDAEDAIAPLFAAYRNALPEIRPIIETALLDIGIDGDIAYHLSLKGSSPAIRIGAFHQLADASPERAQQALDSILSRRDDPARALFLHEALVQASAPEMDAILDSLENAPLDDQLVILSAIADLRLSAYESTILNLLPDSEGALRTALVQTLGLIGSEASFEPLVSAFQDDPDNDEVHNALARLPAPVANATALSQVANSKDRPTRLLYMKILAIRNPQGSAELLNSMVRNEGNKALREAALDALESVGNIESVRTLVNLVLLDDAFTRSAQRALKRLSVSLGAADYQWKTIYLPALEAAGSDEAREGLILILDGVPGELSLDYLSSLIADDSSALRPAALRTLARWPSVDAGDIWITIASRQDASKREVATASKALKRILEGRDIQGSADDKLELAVRAVQTAPSADFKRDILSVYDELNGGQQRYIREIFDPLLGDADVATRVAEILDFEEE